jgi:hypothetical protein
MKQFLLTCAVAVVLAGCSKSSDTSTDQSTAAASAATASAAAGSSATAAAAAGATDSAAGTATATGAAMTTATDAPTAAAAAAAGASGAPFVAIDLPVYPGATKAADKGLDMSSNGTSVKMDFYSTKDDAATVIAWYKAHLPSNWQNFTVSNGGKTAGTFSSPEHGNDGQSVFVEGQDSGGTQMQLTTKTGS